MATVIRIDNVDPQIIYSGTWTTYANKDGYNNTISLTRTIGNSAILNFVGKYSINRNSVAAFGQLGPNPPNAPAITQYQVDDGDPVTFAPASPSMDLTRLLFYQSPALPYGPHKLVMTNMMQLDWIWFDYFEVTTIGDPQPQPQPPSPPTAPSTDTPSFPNNTSAPGSTGNSTTPSFAPASSTNLNQSLLSTPTRSTTDSVPSPSFTSFTGIPIGAPTFIASAQGASSSKPAPTGAIVGAVIGSLFLLSFTGIILLLFLRRRKRNTIQDASPPESVTNLFRTPSRSPATQQIYHPTQEMFTRDGRGETDWNTASPNINMASSGAPLSISTTESMFTAGEPRTAAPLVSKRRLQLVTVASPELPLPPYSVN